MRSAPLAVVMALILLASVGAVTAASYFDTITQSAPSSGTFAQCVFYQHNATTAAANITGISKHASSTPARGFLWNGTVFPTNANCATGTSPIDTCTFSGNVCTFANGLIIQAGQNVTVGIDNHGGAWTQYYGSTGMPATGNTTRIRWLGAQSNGGTSLDGSPRSITGVYFSDVASPPGATSITAGLNNSVNGTAWPSTVLLGNITGALTLSFFNITATGFCVNATGNGSVVNCTAGSGTGQFFDATLSATIVDGATVYGQTFQAWLNVTAQQLYTGATITSFNASSGIPSNTTTSGQLLLRANAQPTTVTVNVTGNGSRSASCTPTNLSTLSCNVSGFSDSTYGVNVTDALSGALVTAYTLQLRNGSYAGLANFTTTNGTVNVPVLQGSTFDFLVDVAGYAVQNAMEAVTASTRNLTLNVLPENSILLYFYDADTLSPVLQNVTVLFVKGNTSTINSSTSGSVVARNLTSGTYSIQVTTASYATASYMVTVGNRSTQTITVYLINASTGTTTFTIRDQTTGDVVPGVQFTMQELVGANYVTIGQVVSDAFGTTSFGLDPGDNYQFILNASGYEPRVGQFVPTQSAYTITITPTASSPFQTYQEDFNFILAPSSVNASNTSFNITTASPDGRIQWFSVTVLLNGTNTTSNVTGSPNGGTAVVWRDLAPFRSGNVIVVYRVKSVTFADPYEVVRVFSLYQVTPGNYTATDFLEHYADDANGLSWVSRAVLLTVAAVFVALALGFMFGAPAAGLGALVVFGIGAWFGWIHWTFVILGVGALVFGLLARRGGA